MSGQTPEPAAFLAPPVTRTPPDGKDKIALKQALGTGAVVLAALVASIDERLSTLAQTDLVGHFGYGDDEGSWIESGYLVGELIVLPVVPWLVVIFSPRRVAAVLIVIAALAALLCARMPPYGWLVALRTMQGIGDGGLLPVLLGVLTQSVPKSHKRGAMAVFALVVTGAGLLAPTIEDVMVSLFNFRGLFWLMPAIGPVCLFLVLACMPFQPPKWSQFREGDFFGVFALVAVVGFLTVGLSQGQRLDWFASPFIIAAFGLAGWFGALFVWNEFHTQGSVYNLLTLERVTFTAGLPLIFLAAMGLLSTDYLLPLDQVMVRDLRLLQVGNIELWLLLPALLSAFVTTLLLRALDSRLVILAGLVLLLAGLWPFAWITPVWDGDDAEPWLALGTAGAVMAIAANAYAATGVLDEKTFATGAVLFNLFRGFGFLGGTAILQGIVTVRTRVHSDEAIASYVDITRLAARERLLTDGPILLDRMQVVQSAVMAFADGWGWLAIFVLCGLPVILLQGPGVLTLPRRR